MCCLPVNQQARATDTYQADVPQEYPKPAWPGQSQEMRISNLRDLVKVQRREAGKGDAYMDGLYNGMELALATVEGRQPQFASSSRG